MYAELSGFREQLTPFTLFGGVLTVVFAALLISFGFLDGKEKVETHGGIVCCVSGLRCAWSLHAGVVGTCDTAGAGVVSV